MLRHIVIFKFQQAASKLDIENALHQYSELFNKIETIKAIEGGRNISKLGFDGGFSQALVLTFNDESDRDTFMSNPVHLDLNNNTLKPLVEAVMVIDYIPESSFEKSR